MTVTDIHPGGQAHFHCDPGFEVRGHEVATCLNSTRPKWSTPEPQCVGGLHFSFSYFVVFQYLQLLEDISVYCLVYKHSHVFLYIKAVSCGGWIRNASVGRILSPTLPSASNHSSGSNLSCHWLLEAKEGHRLHLHFERVALDEDNDK